jgi:hypothetical protein
MASESNVRFPVMKVPMSDVFYFGIHELLTFSIQFETHEKNTLLQRRLIGEYQTFALAAKPQHVSMSFIITDRWDGSGRGLMSLEEGQYLAGPDTLVIQDSYKLARWRAAIHGLDKNETTVIICPNVFGYLFVGGYIIDALIRIKMLDTGGVFLHAGAVTNGTCGIVMAARSGSGKTILTSALVSDGWSTLGDNFVIIRDGRVLSFLSRVNLFSYNLTPEIAQRLNRGQLRAIRLKQMLYTLSLGYAKIFTPVAAPVVYGNNVAPSAPFTHCMLLLKADRLRVAAAGRESLVKSLIRNNQLDTLPFHTYLTAYSYANPRSPAARYWERSEAVIAREINAIAPERMHIIHLPEKIGADCVGVIKGIAEK